MDQRTREQDYRLIEELWTFHGNRIAVRFAYECHDDSGNWFRSYGNENWEFNDEELMRVRLACINDLPIQESERKYHWPLGRRPDDHLGLSDLGLQYATSVSSFVCWSRASGTFRDGHLFPGRFMPHLALH